MFLLKNNNLHIEILVNKEGNIGAGDNAGIDDIIIESALTTIQDCEDSVATVDVIAMSDVDSLGFFGRAWSNVKLLTYQFLMEE